MATDNTNEYLLDKLKEYRGSLRRKGQVSQAMGISSVMSNIKKFPLPILSSKVAELIQGVGKNYAELIGSWLASKPQKRKAEEVSAPVKTAKVVYPPGSDLWVGLLCCSYIPNSPFKFEDVREAFETGVALDFCCEFPQDIEKVMERMVRTQDIQRISSSEYALTPMGEVSVRQLLSVCPAHYRRRTSQGSAETQPDDVSPELQFDPDAWFQSEPVQSASTQSEAGLSIKDTEFDIVLLVDTAERLTDDFAYFSTQLQGRGITVSKQKLWIGDYHWIVQPKNSVIAYSLGVLVERKAAQDLAASIVDGRYQAQKRRIKDSGAQCIYLLEGTNPSKFQMISHDSLMNAVVNTMLKYGFQIKITRNVHDTTNWLGRMTSVLKRRVGHFSAKRWAELVPFKEFQDLTNPSRTATVQSVFGKQLRSLPGCGAQATDAVLKQFPTPSSLHMAIHQCASQRARKKLLKSILLSTGNKLQKRIVDSLLELFG